MVGIIRTVCAALGLLFFMGSSSWAAELRPDVCPQWCAPNQALRWPKNNGFKAAPLPLVLPPGVLMDRFGEATGHFFSPKGASYDARALPYVCASQTYSVYRVVSPLLVWTGMAAPWFGEKGGATQFLTDESVAGLLADHVIEAVPDTGATPCSQP